MMHGAVTRFAAAFPVHLPMLSQCREGIEMTGGLAICGRIAGDGSDRNRQTKKMSSSVSCVTASVRTSLWLIGFSFVFVFFFFSISSTTAIFYHPAGACLARYGRTGLFFHVVGEGVVRLLKNGRQHISDRENYIDFRMRLLGEPGNAQHILHFFFFFLRPVSPSVNHTRRWAAPPVERRRRFIANISPLLVSLFQFNMTRLMKCTCNTVIWCAEGEEKRWCAYEQTPALGRASVRKFPSPFAWFIALVSNGPNWCPCLSAVSSPRHHQIWFFNEVKRRRKKKQGELKQWRVE